ncbi:MAG: hypothetical protein ABI432_14095 [Flavobacteriales bacterium]
MITRTLLALAIGVGTSVSAQEPVYRWGQPATNDFPERRIEQLLQLGDQGFVLLRASEDATTVKHYWLERYSSKLEYQSTTEVAFNVGVMGDSQFLDEVKAVNGVIYAFITRWNKASGKHTLSVKRLGFDGSLTDIADLDVIQAEKMGNRGNYRRAFSDDGTKLLVLAELPFEKGMKEKIRLMSFSVPGMERTWTLDKELELDADRGASQEIATDNKGRAFIFKRSWQKPVWTYTLYASDGKAWKRHAVTGPTGMEIEDLRMDFDQANACVVYATYTTNPSAYSKELNGSWFARFGDDLELATNRMQPWPTDIVTHFSGEHNAENAAKAKLDDFTIKDLLFRSDGRMLVLLEQQRSESKPVAGSSPIQYSYTWNYGDVLAICLDVQSGDPVWWQSFDKQQEVHSNTSVDEYGSFVYFLSKDRLYMLWNNTELSVPSIPAANWTEPDGTRYVKHKAFDAMTVHATFMHVIEPDGKLAYIDRKYGLPLFHLHEGAVFEMSLSPSFFFVLNGDLVVLATMHNGGKRYRFGFIGL